MDKKGEIITIREYSYGPAAERVLNSLRQADSGASIDDATGDNNVKGTIEEIRP